MSYQILNQDECDEHLVDFLLAQERDHYLHGINRDRYAKMLKTLEPGLFRDRVQKLHDDTINRLAEVSAIIQASDPPSKPRIVAAMARLEAKRAAKQ